MKVKNNMFYEFAKFIKNNGNIRIIFGIPNDVYIYKNFRLSVINGGYNQWITKCDDEQNPIWMASLIVKDKSEVNYTNISEQEFKTEFQQLSNCV
jgi:hypothetical protein